MIYSLWDEAEIKQKNWVKKIDRETQNKTIDFNMLILNPNKSCLNATTKFAWLSNTQSALHIKSVVQVSKPSSLLSWFFFLTT